MQRAATFALALGLANFLTVGLTCATTISDTLTVTVPATKVQPRPLKLVEGSGDMDTGAGTLSFTVDTNTVDVPVAGAHNVYLTSPTDVTPANPSGYSDFITLTSVLPKNGGDQLTFTMESPGSGHNFRQGTDVMETEHSLADGANDITLDIYFGPNSFGPTNPPPPPPNGTKRLKIVAFSCPTEVGNQSSVGDQSCSVCGGCPSTPEPGTLALIFSGLVVALIYGGTRLYRTTVATN